MMIALPLSCASCLSRESWVVGGWCLIRKAYVSVNRQIADPVSLGVSNLCYFVEFGDGLWGNGSRPAGCVDGISLPSK